MVARLHELDLVTNPLGWDLPADKAGQPAARKFPVEELPFLPPGQSQPRRVADKLREPHLTSMADLFAAGDGVTDDAAKLAAAMVSGRRIVGEAGKTYLIKSRVEAPIGLTDFEFDGRGCTIKLDPTLTTWDTTHLAGLLFRNAKRIKLHGFTLDMSGKALKALKPTLGRFRGIMFTNDTLPAMSRTFGSEDIQVYDVKILEPWYRGIVARNAKRVYFHDIPSYDGVAVSSTTRNTSILHGIRVEDYVVERCRHYQAPAEQDQMFACYIVGPGDQDSVGGIYEAEQGMGHVSFIPFKQSTAGTPLIWTAPAAASTTSTGTIDVSSIVTAGYPTGYLSTGVSLSQLEWFFNCVDSGSGANAAFIEDVRINVTAVDNSAKTITVQRVNDAGAAVNWAGQTFVVTGVHIDNMCKRVKIRHCHSEYALATSFILGCDEWEIAGCTADSPYDIGHDAEWSPNGIMRGNGTVHGTAGNSIGQAVLFFTRNVTVKGNWDRGGQGKIGFSFLHHSWGYANKNLNITGNTWNHKVVLADGNANTRIGVLENLNFVGNICPGIWLRNNYATWKTLVMLNISGNTFNEGGPYVDSAVVGNGISGLNFRSNFVHGGRNAPFFVDDGATLSCRAIVIDGNTSACNALESMAYGLVACTENVSDFSWCVLGQNQIIQLGGAGLALTTHGLINDNNTSTKNHPVGVQGLIIGGIMLRESNGVLQLSADATTFSGTGVWKNPGTPEIITRATNFTMTAADAWGQAYKNTGAVAGLTYALPASVAGMEAHFYRDATQVMRIDPNGTETLGTGGAGKYVDLTTDKAFISLRCYAAGHWVILDSAGTLAYEA